MARVELVGGERAMHRVAARVLGKDTLVRQQLVAFAVGPEPLEHYGAAWVALQELSMVSLVERKVESIHAQIKWVGKSITTPRAPYICAKFREKAHLAELRDYPEFFDYCVRR